MNTAANGGLASILLKAASIRITAEQEVDTTLKMMFITCVLISQKISENRHKEVHRAIQKQNLNQLKPWLKVKG